MDTVTVSINSGLTDFVVTRREALEATAMGLGLLLMNGMAMDRTIEGTIEGFCTNELNGQSMRYCFHPEKLMVTTHSHRPGIVMFDEHPQLFSDLMAVVDAAVEGSLPSLEDIGLEAMQVFAP